MKKIRYILSWIFVRPRRRFFWKMICNSDLKLWFYRYEWDNKTRFPNIHWWILYKTIFRFFKYLNYDGWRPFCTWENGWLKNKPLISKIIHRIGQTTAGERISGGECYHCGSPDGDSAFLSEDETGETFILEDTWTSCSENGTDYRFSGTTICPKCGYKSQYEDGSL